jgi:hypothetical protein
MSNIYNSSNYNNTYCLQSSPGDPRPLTASPVCVIPIGVNQGINLTTVLKSCCGSGASIATYGNLYPNGLGFPCFQYCNITQPALNYTQVQQCLSNSPGTTGITISCGGGYNTTQKSDALRHKSGVSRLWLVVFGLAMAGSVLGGDILRIVLV